MCPRYQECESGRYIGYRKRRSDAVTPPALGERFSAIAGLWTRTDGANDARIGNQTFDPLAYVGVKPNHLLATEDHCGYGTIGTDENVQPRQRAFP